jgi:hypothetical protein
MPAYPGVTGAVVPVNSTISPIEVKPGDWLYLFGTFPQGTPPAAQGDQNVVFEAVAVNEASWPALIAPAPGETFPSIGIEIIGNSATPGAAVFQIQEADSDADGLYITPTNTTYTVSAFIAVGSTSVARADLSPTGGRFQRVKCTANPNGLTWKVKLTRQ